MTAAAKCRPPRDDELDAVAQVWHESARTADDSPSDMPSVAELRARIDTEMAQGWTLSVASVEGRIVGLLALKKTEGVVDQLFVLPSAQRSGVGTLLLKRAMEDMPDGFTLRTASANLGARRFYERMGLKLLLEGKHPSRGHPVCFYGWKIR